jgi:hypothetical protein
LISSVCINDSYRSSNPCCSTFAIALDVESLATKKKNDASLNRHRDDDEGAAAATAIIGLMLCMYPKIFTIGAMAKGGSG